MITLHLCTFYKQILFIITEHKYTPNVSCSVYENILEIMLPIPLAYILLGENRFKIELRSSNKLFSKKPILQVS